MTAPIDAFHGAKLVNGPMTTAFAITPSDADPLPKVTRQLRIISSGNIAVVFQDDSASLTIAVTAGELLDWRVKQVKATGTTATLLGLA